MSYYKYRKRSVEVNGKYENCYLILNPPKSFRGLKVMLYNNGHGWHGLESHTRQSVMPPSWRAAKNNKTRDGAVSILAEKFENASPNFWKQASAKINYEIKSEPLSI